MDDLIATLQEQNATLRAERDHFQQQLAQNERAQFMLETMPIGFVIGNVQGQCVESNRAMQEIVGYSEQELRNMPFSEFTHPDDLMLELPMFEGIIAGERSQYEVQKRYIRKDGQLIYVYLRVTVVRTPTGDVDFFIGTIEDITNRIATEIALQRSEEKLQFALDGSDNALWDADLISGSAEMSERYHEMLGYDYGELDNSVNGWLRAIHPDDLPRVSEQFQGYLDGRILTYQVEHRLNHKSGGWVWVLSRGKVVAYDSEGRPQRMTGTITDITEEKRFQDDLRENERRLRSMFENSPIGMYRTTPEGHFVAANPAMARILGYESTAELMQTITSVGGQLYADAQQRDTITHLLQDSDEAVETEVAFLRKDGTQITVALAAWLVLDENGDSSFIEGLFEDISERRRAEQERAILQQQVIDAQHDALRELSTPLIPITDTTVVMPLIGSMDTRRAQQVLEALLEGVAQHQAELVILDITGVQTVDTQVAQVFTQAAQAMRLLGANVMLTGIQPQIAQTLIRLGVDLSGIQTQSSLQAGIAVALNGQRTNGQRTNGQRTNGQRTI